MDNNTYSLEENEYIDSIFDKIPSNSNINKGKCGIGGTTLELTAQRNSIIVVPNLSTIRSKKMQHGFIYVVNGDVGLKEIENYFKEITKSGKYIKIMTTPESLYKIVQASDNIGYNVRDNVFLLLDEFHTATTESSYRPNIIKVFEYFFQFREKSMISATPYKNTDPRFEDLEQIIIKVNRKIKNSVKIVYSKHINATLKDLIKEIHLNGGNAHVFYNSIKAIVEVVDLIGKEGVSIFCSSNPVNMEKLGKYKGLLRNTSKEGFSPNRVNFYTCGHHEGWDLIDDKVTFIFVSDIEDEKTCFNIGIKGVQGIGRLRGLPKEVYHIVNLQEIEEVGMVKTSEEVFNLYKHKAEKLINFYKTINEEFDFKPVFEDELSKGFIDVVEKFADFNAINGEPVINLTKIDSLVYTALTGLQYANRNTLAKEWMGAGYEVEVIEDSARLSKKERAVLRNARTAKSKENKILIDAWHNHQLAVKKAKVNGTLYFGNSLADDIKDTHPDLLAYYNALGYKKIVELNYNTKRMKEAYICQYEASGMVTREIVELISDRYKSNRFYTSEDIKRYLQYIYNRLGLKKIAKATDISKYFYVAEDMKFIKGKVKRGFVLGIKKILAPSNPIKDKALSVPKP